MKTFLFGTFPVPITEIFHTTQLSIAMVNYKPIVPGHSLILPKRVVKRFQDLTQEEVNDLFQTTQAVGKVLEKVYHSTALTIAIQDGKDAGQTVEHVHVHILPRKKGDFENNDDVYPAIEKNEEDLKMDAEERPPRTAEDMQKEAEMLSKFFNQ